MESPFDFERQALLLVPSDMPEPNRPEYQRALDRALIALGTAMRGRTMVLFTSHAGLRESYHAIRGPLGDAGITVIGQGLDGSRNTLLATFKDPETPSRPLGHALVLGGIDIPGEALSCLVITRIPFDVPTDPLFAALERLDDAFLALDPAGAAAVPPGLRPPHPHARRSGRRAPGRPRERSPLRGRLPGLAGVRPPPRDAGRPRPPGARMDGRRTGRVQRLADAPKMARTGLSRVEYPGFADAGASDRASRRRNP
ncbi:MAG: helicase C-terminal domain-containing protein [Anaerolineae bacterium]